MISIEQGSCIRFMPKEKDFNYVDIARWFFVVSSDKNFFIGSITYRLVAWSVGSLVVGRSVIISLKKKGSYTLILLSEHSLLNESVIN